MVYLFNNIKIFYDFKSNNSKITNVYLHGWGCDHTSFLFCNDYLKKENSLFIDFPPFGQSETPQDWTIFTYANMVISLCEHLELKNVNLIGHSFGGRVAIIMSVLCKQQVEKVVLVDSAGIKPKRKISYYFKVYSYKIRKKLKKDTSNYGSCDYLALDQNMRKIFNNIVNTHLDDFLSYIKAETLIVFGENDATTPPYMAKKIKKKIRNSKLVFLENAGHFCFVDRRLEFLNVVKNFIEGEN